MIGNIAAMRSVSPDCTSASIQALAPVCIIRAGCIRTDFLPNFGELRKGEVRRIPLPRTPVDRASVGEVRLVASYAGREGPKQGSGYFVFHAHPVGWTGSCGGRRPLLLRINTVPPYQVPDRFARYR